MKDIAGMILLVIFCPPGGLLEVFDLHEALP